MRISLGLVLPLLLLAWSPSTSAQLIEGAPISGNAPSVTGTEGSGLSLSGLFNKNTVRIGHSYEFSYTSMAGGSLGLGIYTTSLQWQPSRRLAARVDVGVAHSPFGSGNVQNALGFDSGNPVKLYLRNAEIAYRPTDNSVIQLRFQQNPFGYARGGPFGPAGGNYGYGSGFYPHGYSAVGMRPVYDRSPLFFRDFN